MNRVRDQAGDLMERRADRPPLVQGAKRLQIWGVVLTFVTIILSVAWGEELTLHESIYGLGLGPNAAHPSAVIIWWVRLPRLVTALIAGATLSLTGAAMQSVMRNDLADPYLLGVASGGGLGAALALSLGVIDTWGLWTLPCSSFGGALAASLWVERGARTNRAHEIGSLEHKPDQLILAGVALNLFLSALLTLTLALSAERLSGVWRWLVGHVDGLAWSEITLMSLGALSGTVLLLSQRRALELLPAGEDVAWTLGIDVHYARSMILIAIALAVGAVVAYCGVIGFVGLLVPHMIRPRILGESRRLFGLSALYGAGVLALCDVISRLGPRAVPVGVVTGVLGGAVFLYSQRVGAR